MQLSNPVYERVKWLVQIALPALGTLYFTLSQLWGLPFGEKVVGTITALALFLGVLVGISKAQYLKTGEFDGTIEVDKSSNAVDTYTLSLNDSMDKLVPGGTVTFNVQDVTANMRRLDDGDV